MLKRRKSDDMILTHERQNEMSTSVGCKDNIDNNGEDEDSDEGEVVESTFEENEFEENWKRRKNKLVLLGNEKSDVDEQKNNYYDREGIVPCSDGESSIESDISRKGSKKESNFWKKAYKRDVCEVDKTRHNNKSTKTETREKYIDRIQSKKQDNVVLEKGSKKKIDEHVRDYFRMEKQELLTADNCRDFIKFMMKREKKENSKNTGKSVKKEHKDDKRQ